MFSLDQYRSLLADLTAGGWFPRPTGIRSQGPTLLLRHDVDFSVDFAHKLATVEFNLGIHSTYFFMLTSNMYNLISGAHKELVKDIAKMGHKVSIHFDPTAYDQLKKFEDEKKLFESIL